MIKKLEELNKKLISIKEPNLDSKDPMRKAFRQFMGIVSELVKEIKKQSILKLIKEISFYIGTENMLGGQVEDVNIFSVPI